MRSSNYIVYDCETGGLNCEEHPITQFACSIIDFKTLKEIAKWETYIRPYNDLEITKEALDLTMVTMKDVNNGIDINDFVQSFRKLLIKYNTVKSRPELGKLIPVGHNIPFDNRFISYAFKLCNLDFSHYVVPNFIDTYSLGKMAFCSVGKEKLTLTACCEYAGITLKDAHSAMNDVNATAELLKYFIGKMRSKVKNVKVDTGERKQGTDFFEFCKKSRD